MASRRRVRGSDTRDPTEDKETDETETRGLPKGNGEVRVPLLPKSYDQGPKEWLEITKKKNNNNKNKELK